MFDLSQKSQKDVETFLRDLIVLEDCNFSNMRLTGLVGRDTYKVMRRCNFNGCNLQDATIHWSLVDCTFVGANIDSCYFVNSHRIGDEILEADLSRIKSAFVQLYQGLSADVLKGLISKIEQGVINGNSKFDCLKGWIKQLSPVRVHFDGYSIEEVWMSHVNPGDKIRNNVFLRAAHTWATETETNRRGDDGLQSTARSSEEKDSRRLGEAG